MEGDGVLKDVDKVLNSWGGIFVGVGIIMRKRL
jgi:hypothetical protein